jgi:uncharacterized membrane protein
MKQADSTDLVGDPGQPASDSDSTITLSPPRAAIVGLDRSWLERAWTRARTLQAATWFLVLAMPAGLFLLFVVPPFQGLDEPNHFYRSYTIGQGVLSGVHRGIRTGAWVPKCLPDYVDFQFRRAGGPGPFQTSEFIQQPTLCDAQQTAFVAFENTAYYSPVPYVAQAAVLAVGWRLTTYLPVLFYSGRLAAFATYLGLVFLALRLAPVGRSVLFLAGVWPMSLLVATTYSADGATIALALVLVACVLRARHQAGAGWPLFVLAGAVAVSLALSKSTYFVLAVLLLLIPGRLFPTWWASLAAKAAALALVALVSAGWYLHVRDITLAANFPAGAINPAKQIAFIVHHPLRYARFARDMLIGQPVGYFTWETLVLQVGFFRSVVPGEPFPPPWMMVLGYCLILQVYLRELARPLVRSALGLVEAAIPIGLALLNAALAFTAIFVAATSSIPGSLVTLQGRYFLPLLAVPLVSLSVVGAVRTRLPSMLPLVPFVLLMYAGLVVKVQGLFY